MSATRQSQIQFSRAAVRIFFANDRMNQLLIEHLDLAAWKARPPGNARTIAAVFTHMHNVRCKWVRLSAPHLGVPPLLKRADCTPRQARAGLAESAARCAEMLCYMVAHEAHHRGQVCMLAHQLGFPLSNKVTSGIWNWEKLWKEPGWSAGPGGDSASDSEVT